MNLYQCQKYAEKNGFDSMKFNAHFPTGIRKCQWLDAYFGLFTIEGVTDNSFISVRDVDEAFPSLICTLLENTYD